MLVYFFKDVHWFCPNFSNWKGKNGGHKLAQCIVSEVICDNPLPLTLSAQRMML